MDILPLIEASARVLSESDDSGIVLSSRVRLARNFAGIPFPSRASAEERLRVLELVRRSAATLATPVQVLYLDFSALSPLQQEALVECHIVSRQLVTSPGERALVVTVDARLSAMVHEEDHLRLQAMMGGLDLQEALARVRMLEEDLGQGSRYAYRAGLGFLTSCPTNVGTGLRASVMLRLPSLFFLQKLDFALRKRVPDGMAMRGLYGEGTAAAACLLQLSNQVTAGIAETALVDRVQKCAQGLIEDEERARAHLLHRFHVELEDLVYRALATLRSARMISSEEAMERLTQLRLGVDLGVLEGPSARLLDRLLLLVRPATLQLFAEEEIPPRERDIRRAEMIQAALAESEA